MKVDKKIKQITYIPLIIGMLSLAHSLKPIGFLFFTLLFLAIYIDTTFEIEVPNTILTIIGILGSIFFMINAFRTPFESIAHLIMFISIVKVLGKKTMRDLKQIVALSFFNFIDSAIFHYSAIFLLYLLLYIVSITVALLLITFTEDRKTVSIERELFSKISKFGIVFGIFVTIFSLFFFVILPRSPYVILRPQIYAPSKRVGFENELTIGEVENLSSKEQILMRIKPTGHRRENYIYVRGIVYNKYDGFTWIREPEHIPGWEATSKAPTGLKQFSITIEPMKTSVIYAPNFPEKIEIRGFTVIKSWGKIFMISTNEIFRKNNYIAYSSTFEDTSYVDTLDYFSIPPEYEETLDSMLQQIKIPDFDSERKAKYIENYFHNNFKYEITNFQDRKWIQRFLEEKKGYCEHFATISALLLRKTGIPSRVVGGFITNEWNNFGKYYIIRTKHAHTWVEYFDGKSWKSIDPTPPRQERERSLLLERLNSYIDFLSYIWTTQVLEFSFMHQVKLFLNIRTLLTEKLKKNLKTFLIFTIMVISSSLTTVLFLKKISTKEHFATKYFRKFERLLKKKGVTLKPGTTVYEILKDFEFPEIKEFLEEYLKCRFSPSCDRSRLVQKFNELKRRIS
ncbi:MAG: DUF3488 and transglutaminase-like domain-containing protein [candidate division WOR-3 bacterium]